MPPSHPAILTFHRDDNVASWFNKTLLRDGLLILRGVIQLMDMPKSVTRDVQNSRQRFQESIPVGHLLRETKTGTEQDSF